MQVILECDLIIRRSSAMNISTVRKEGSSISITIESYAGNLSSLAVTVLGLDNIT